MPPVIKSWKLNERHYGALQGLNKTETEYGDEQVQSWRRFFDVRPPALEPNDPRNPAFQKLYDGIDPSELSLAESLKDTIARTVPYFEQEILPQLQNEKRVLITAHGNSLRAPIMRVEKVSTEEIMQVNLPTGVPLVYEFANNFTITKKTILEIRQSLQTR